MTTPASAASSGAGSIGTARAVRKRHALLLMLLGLLLALGYWYRERSHWVVVDDARIASNIVSISSKLPGRISDFPVTDGQIVDGDSLLVQIDPSEAVLALEAYPLKIAAKQASIERGQAQLRLTEASVYEQVKFQQAQLQSSEAGLAKAESELQLANSNFQRADALRQKQLLSQQGWEQQQLALQVAERGYQQAQAELAKRESEVNSARATLHKLEIDEKSLAVMEQELAQLRVEQAQLRQRLADHQIRSPIAGVVDRTFVHAGEFVTPGKRLLMIHDPSDLWISANVKETELRHIKLGASARVWVDSYPDRPFAARVERIDHATTSEFALLPNPNPSGNFTKVTQRVAVRLAIAQPDARLKPGMMVEVEIDRRG